MRYAKDVEREFKIVMWSWLSYDYDAKVPVSTILDKSKKIEKGDILVVCATIVYGDPPTARVERGEMEVFGDIVPIRNRRAEDRLIREAGEQLGLAVGFFLVVPKFMAMALAKVASKCFDYSIFRAAKEILYIPLSPLERVQGKAVVDILAYRVTKGAVTLFLKGALALISVSGLVMGLTLGVICLWLVITYFLLKAHRQHVAETSSSLQD